jgi:hypothetical protein
VVSVCTAEIIEDHLPEALCEGPTEWANLFNRENSAGLGTFGGSAMKYITTAVPGHQRYGMTGRILFRGHSGGGRPNNRKGEPLQLRRARPSRQPAWLPHQAFRARDLRAGQQQELINETIVREDYVTFVKNGERQQLELVLSDRPRLFLAEVGKEKMKCEIQLRTRLVATVKRADTIGIDNAVTHSN